MPKYLTALQVSPLANRLWILDADFVVETEKAGTLTIPAGFIFDGNSLPRALWWESLPTDYFEAGCVHDYLYRFGDDRKLADEVYRDLLALHGVGKVKRNLRYFALRMFGGIAYAHDKEKA